MEAVASPLIPNPKVDEGMKMTTRASASRALAIKEVKDRIKANGWPQNYHVVQNTQELGRIALSISRTKHFAFDTETRGLNPWSDKCYCVSIYVDGTAYLVNFEHALLPSVSVDEYRSILGSYFNDPRVKRVGFNIAFDEHVHEEQLGIPCGPSYFDASIGIWLLKPDAPSKKLKNLCESLLGIEGDTYESIFGKTAWVMIDPLVASYYACKDAELHWKLYEWEESHLKAS